MRQSGFFSRPREVARIAWLVVFLVLTLRVTRFAPGLDTINNAWLILCALFLIGPYLLNKILSGLSFSLFELYVLFLMVVMPFITSLTAFYVFGQPLYYGLGVQRSVLLYTGAFFIIYAYRRGMIGIGNIENAFLILSWCTLLLFTAVTLFLDPSVMIDEGAFIIGGHKQPAAFNLSTIFIVFGFIYYIIRGYKRRNMTDYLLSSPFLLYIFFIDKGRARLVAMLLAAMILVALYGSLRRNILFSIKASIAVIMLSFLFYTANSVYVLTYLNRLSDAFVVLFLGTNVADVSANQRIFESLIAIPYIAKHWLLGCGRISNLWSGGPSGVVGAYFFPGDIGMLGVLFMHGILGSFVYALQFFFPWRFVKWIPESYEHHTFVLAVSGYVWFYAIHSIVAGLFVHYLEVGLLMAAVLYCARIDTVKRLQESESVLNHNALRK
jgi:hypothetical protein